MIVFGHNNFLLKSYSPTELGIPDDNEGSGIKFEIRQRYAHLFWIPFFPIGKLWAIKKEGDKSLYQMPVEIQNLILARHGKPGTPWYSFFLILAGLTIGLLSILGDAIESQQYEAKFYNEVEETKMLIKYPTTGDCYVLQKYDSQDSWENSTILLKVNSYTDSKIEFISLSENLYKDADYTIVNNAHEQFDIAEAFNFNPTSILKSELVKAVKQNYHGSSTPVQIKNLQGYFLINEINRRNLDDLN